MIPEKPVYVKGIEGSNQYLENLRTPLGETVTWERQGSLAVNGINGMVDIYEIILPSGKLYRTIYLNMYGTQNSTKLPKGFAGKKSPCGTNSNSNSKSKTNETSDRITIDLTVPANVLDQYIDEVYQANINNYRVPGFRTGKAPRTVVEKIYGENEFLEEAVDRCIENEGLKKLKSMGLLSRCKPNVTIINASKINGVVAEIEYSNCEKL